ncbi:MAG TPA: PHP-associated domain-containing protein [Vicinamibacterales bacterium]|nr:PHP-associated domain-containing protein [Vicinamibacterales bacterium]
MTGDHGRVLRADLHLHSYHSGYAGHLRFLRARDCYSEPAAVYAAAKARGMDVVTITDHDSIDGCLELLDGHPDAADFFISEEIECRFPGVDLKVHIGAYDITERIHREIQPLRPNVFEAVAYLQSEGIFHALNHPFFFFKGQMPFDEYVGVVQRLFTAFEVRNGTMLAAHNELTATIVHGWAASSRAPLTELGGSDSHTLRGIGTTYTEAPGSTRDEFLQSLRAGRARAGGSHGSAWREAREIYGVVGRYWGSLVGAGRRDLSWPRRALGLAFSAASMPFEFSPLVVAAIHKREEARRVSAYRREWKMR